jgi:glycosyltransferase involved in cell wall biosynthesis
MQAADIFVFPSHSEGMPNAVMEAMAVGLPVVVTRVGGIPDALEGCQGALLVEPADPAALREALESVLEDSAARVAMRVAGREKALQDFNVECSVKRMLGLFADISGKRSR